MLTLRKKYTYTFSVSLIYTRFLPPIAFCTPTHPSKKTATLLSFITRMFGNKYTYIYYYTHLRRRHISWKSPGSFWHGIHFPHVQSSYH